MRNKHQCVISQLGIRKILGVLLAGLLVSSCGEDKKEGGALPVVPVVVETLVPQDFEGEQRFAASLEGQQAVEIRPKISALVTKLYVDEGDTVRRGQLLFTLETHTLSQDADAAKYAVEIAQVDVDRLSYLVEENVISPVQLATAKGNLESAKAKYKSIQANIGYSQIESPLDGLVGLLPYKVGSLVSPTMSMPMTTVSDIDNIRVYFSLNEKQLLHFIRDVEHKVAQHAKVFLVLPDNSLYEHTGQIEIISGQVNAATGSVAIRAFFPNPKKILRHGGSGTIVIPIKMKNVIVIPQKATFSIQDKQFVYLVNDKNTLVAKEIQISNEKDSYYVVESGISPGDKIVLDGVFKLKDGMRVKPSANLNK